MVPLDCANARLQNGLINRLLPLGPLLVWLNATGAPGRQPALLECPRRFTFGEPGDVNFPSPF
jgi:hypothetical protein